MAGAGNLPFLLVGMDMEVGEREKMVGLVVGGGREKNRDVTAIEAVCVWRRETGV